MIEAKAHRLLASGCVAVVHADERSLVAEVEGDHGRYLVVVEDGRPRCTCPSWRPCSHALAVELVAGRRTHECQAVPVHA